MVLPSGMSSVFSHNYNDVVRRCDASIVACRPEQLRACCTMLGGLRSRVLRHALLVLYVLASASLPFAHRTPRSVVPAELASFVLPDGTLPVICGQSLPGEPGKRPSHAALCDACCLISAPGLPPVADIGPAVPSVAIGVAPFPDVEVHSAVFVASLGARGPPAL